MNLVSSNLSLFIPETLVRGDLYGTFSLFNEPDGRGITASVIVPR